MPGPTELRRALDPELSYRWLRAAQPRPALCWGKAQASGAVARSVIFPAPRNDSFHTEKWMFL